MTPQMQGIIDWSDELDDMLSRALELVGEQGRDELVTMIKKRYDNWEQRCQGREQFIALAALSGLAHVLKRYSRAKERAGSV